MEDNRLYTVKDLLKDLEGFDPDAVIYPPEDSTADYLFGVDNSHTKLDNGLDAYWMVMTFEQEAKNHKEAAQLEYESQID